MRNKMQNLLLSALLTVLLVGFGVQPGVAQPPLKTVPVWSTDVGQLNQLGNMETVDEFTVRPPKGFKYLKQPGLDGVPIHGWVGETRADGTRPQFVMMTFSPSYDVRRSDLEPALAALMAGYEAEKKDWKRGPVEHGLINGIYFVRTRWEGFDVSLNRKLFGFSYLATVDKKIVQISSQDVEAFQTALALAEAAAQTFNKK